MPKRDIALGELLQLFPGKKKPKEFFKKVPEKELEFKSELNNNGGKNGTNRFTKIVFKK